MAYKYTNRKGVTYYLRSSTTKRGKTRYIFARQPGGDEVETLPEGYKVRESINGQVSLVQARPRQITKAEEQNLRDRLARLKPGYRLEVKGSELVIFEPSMSAGSLMGVLGGPSMAAARPGLADELARFVAQRARFDPILKFELVDELRRRFSAHRMVFSGAGGWSHPLEYGDLDQLARTLLPHLGEDSFFELV